MYGPYMYIKNYSNIGMIMSQYGVMIVYDASSQLIAILSNQLVNSSALPLTYSDATH